MIYDEVREYIATTFHSRSFAVTLRLLAWREVTMADNEEARRNELVPLKGVLWFGRSEDLIFES